MAICIDGNFVCLGGGCFCQTPTGVEFSGEAVANQFCDPRKFQGTVSGYTVITTASSGTAGAGNIEKFPFTSDTNSSDIAELAQPFIGRANGGSSSATHGYLFPLHWIQ